MGSIVKLSEDDFESALSIVLSVLRSGGVFIYPTDTVYGIGGDATSHSVIEKIHKIKGSDPHKPMSVMMADFSMVDEYCETGLWEDMVLERYLPGPYTFVLRERLPIPVSSTDKIGVRIPDSPFCQALCAAFGKPIVSTSANFHGMAAPADFADIDKKLIDNCMVALDAGATKYRKSSAIIDLVEKKITRENGEVIRINEE